MNEIMRWLLDHGKGTLETAGLIGGLFYTAASFNADSKERRISNLMELAQSHRDLWLQVTEKPELARILRADVNLTKAPVTVVEERFVHLLITHLAVTYTAVKAGVLPGMEGLEKDVREFFALPIPHKVWTWSRRFQQADFVKFVEHSCGHN
jgi:hypothetical protein